MLTRDQIEKIILDCAGNPSVGPVKDIAPVIADCLAAELSPVEKKAVKPKRETRVVAPDETR